MKSRFFHALLIAIGLFFGGTLVILFEHHSVLTLDPTISFGEIVNSFSTVVAAVTVTVLVTYYLERHNQTNRREKDLLLEQLDFISQLVQDFERCNESGKLTGITASHKKLSTSNFSFYNILKEFNYSQQILSQVDFDGLIKEMWKLATDTPIRAIEQLAKHAKCNATVKDGIISLTAERRSMLESKLTEIKAKILRAKLLINRNY